MHLNFFKKWNCDKVQYKQNADGIKYLNHF